MEHGRLADHIEAYHAHTVALLRQLSQWGEHYLDSPAAEGDAVRAAFGRTFRSLTTLYRAVDGTIALYEQEDL